MKEKISSAGPECEIGTDATVAGRQLFMQCRQFATADPSTTR